jgi:hypothetical protein
LTPWCLPLLLGLVGYGLMDFIVIFAYYVVDRVYTEGASSTFVILGLIFQACLYAFVPVIASSQALERLDSAHEEKILHNEQTNGA